MKKKRYLCCLFTAVLLLLCGCAGREEENGYIVYYVNAAGTSLYEVNYLPSAETFDEMMTELLGQLSEASADSGYVSALPDTVEILGYERGIDALRIDFSESYYDMSNTEEVLLRAAVVKTICQIPGVTKVMITVDQQQLVDDAGEVVPAMDAETFIDTKNGGINSYQYAALVLYFPDSTGTMLIKEVRNLHYSSNMVLERVVVEQLIEGSEYSDRRQVLVSTAKILDISTRNGICTINFNSDFNKKPTENAPSAEAALYAIVNSICETDDSITGVRFRVEGESDVLFWNEVNLNQVFIRNEAVIETEQSETETETDAEPESDEQTQTEELSQTDVESENVVAAADVEWEILPQLRKRNWAI